MTRKDDRAERAPGTDSQPQTALERFTGLLLLLVVASLGWILLAAYRPHWLRLPSVEGEVLIVAGLLSGTVLMVSLVALLHTRR